jgi:hypothetical protein
VAIPANDPPVANSTRGYRALIRAPQLRQRPRSNSQDTTGTLSQDLIDSLHTGQCEGGETIDSPRGTRQMTTLRNEPINSPKTAQTAISTRAVYGYARADPRQLVVSRL